MKYFTSIQELQRLWDERQDVRWGLPSKTFDLQSALLLADMEDEDDELEYVKAATLYALPEVRR